MALLAVRAGSPVGTDALIDELWAGEPPDGAPTTLRSYVSRLRTALGDPAVIERVSAGYVLRLPASSVDVTRFEAGVREGVALLERGRHRRASETLRSALALWRGRPFDGIPDAGLLRPEIVRLEELRMHALRSRIDADLAVGRSGELVDELEGLLAEDPLQEQLWRQLMLALYRSGRQTDALAAYHRARKHLEEQLGIDPGEDLRQLEVAILRQDVPPALGSHHAAAVLPVPLARFIGRTREIEEVLDRLRQARLITLVGVGGVGKTRLALEAARRALESLADEAAFVDFAGLADAALVPSHVAAALGVVEEPGGDLVGDMAERVRATDMLLVLDNCEHVRAAVATLCLRLLERSPELRILATSREVLDITGEAAYAVSPLPVPQPFDDADAVRGSEAVQLLMDRATLTRHGLRVDAATYATAARICRELDGLPLAIELAAARAKALSLDEIAERLRDRFRFLVSWRRLSSARHRTLLEAMAWSYELLAPDAQRLLARLSVFPSGATLESVAVVCADGDEDLAERLVERLVDASLVEPIADAVPTRYRLLETVRQYAVEQLTGEERLDLFRRHAERALHIARSTNLALESVGAGAFDFDLARVELPSIRVALQWAVDADPSLGLEIACSLERLWVIAHAREGIAIFTALLSHDGVPERLRARGLRCRGGCRVVLGDDEHGNRDYEEALAIHRRLGDAAYEAHLLLRLAIDAHRRGDRRRASELAEASAAMGDEGRYAVDAYVGLRLHSDLAFDEGRVEDGFDLIHRAVRDAARARDDWWEIDARLAIAGRALDHARLDDAGSTARAALRLSIRIGDRTGTVWALSMLARESAARGHGRRAGRIWGGLEAEMIRGGPIAQWEVDQASARASVAALAGEEFQAGIAEGSTMPLHDVIADALDNG